MATIAVALLVLSSAATRAAETFPIPAELRPDVDFWRSIFTQYHSTEGVLHDNRNLAIVYAKLDLPKGLSQKVRQARISSRRDEIEQVLRSLAGGKRDNLSAEEARILALWPSNVDTATLQNAVGQVRYQGGLADRFREGLVRSGQWRDYIENQLAALGVPKELAALPHVESSYNPAARSHVGASGIWQFTRSTARRFMRVDHVLDERNDPFAATRGAGRLLAYNFSLTGNWPTAITAYNHGLAGIRRAMREYGDTAYVDILRKYDGRTFGFASRNFYVAFLAALEVDSNAEKFFPGLVRDQPINFELIRLPDFIAADELSNSLGIKPAELASYNLALQPTIWQGSKFLPRDYELRVPAKLLSKPIDQLLASVPMDDWASEQLPDLFHTIVRGDTLSQLAREYDTTVATLAALNSLDSRHQIRTGQQLRLPAAGPAPHAVAATTREEVEVQVEAEVVASVTEVADPDAGVQEPEPEMLGGDGELVAEVQPGEEPQTELLSDPSDYSVSGNLSIEVQSLETLGHFADWLGIRTQRLRDINGLAFRAPVTLGQRITLDFSVVDVATFESRRIAYHRALQDAYFRQHVISGVTEHVIQRGESVWVLSLREYGVPLWLFRQYNPELDLHTIQPGITVRFPTLIDSDSG
jgi:membrane-bound lytic murein transglycosylase D